MLHGFNVATEGVVFQWPWRMIMQFAPEDVVDYSTMQRPWIQVQWIHQNCMYVAEHQPKVDDLLNREFGSHKFRSYGATKVKNND